MAGRPPGAVNKDKPFRDALRLELLAAGKDMRALRPIAQNLIKQAGKDEQNAMGAIREIADRLDGKVPQGIGGDDELDPIKVIARIERLIVDPKDDDE